MLQEQLDSGATPGGTASNPARGHGYMDVAWITSLAFLGSALLLGIRHGIDWDHIAAIADIAGTTTAVGVAGANGGSSGQLVQRRLPLPSVELNAIWLSLLYALGHAS